MLKYLVLFSLSISAINCLGKFNVVSNPPSTTFKGHDALKQSMLVEVYSASLGYTIEQDSNWQGLYLTDPFHLAKGIVTFVVDGVADTDYTKGQQFALKTDEDELETYQTLITRVQERHPSSAGNLIRYEFDDKLDNLKGNAMFSDVKEGKPEKTTFLKATIEEDREFLEDLSDLKSICAKVESSKISADKQYPDVLWFKFDSLHTLSDLHGENTSVTKEAKQLLNDALEQCNVAFNKYYEGNALVNIITSDASHTRRVRRQAAEDPTPEDDLNLAKTYNSNYPVIFNIILWFGVAMFFSLLAICLFIAGMDPGRDSIIYRMTSTRMKKDN